MLMVQIDGLTGEYGLPHPAGGGTKKGKKQSGGCWTLWEYLVTSLRCCSGACFTGGLGSFGILLLPMASVGTPVRERNLYTC